MNNLYQLSDKAQEIGYALIRVAAYMRRKEFRARAEGLALSLVEGVSATEPDGALAAIAATQNIVKLAASVYEIETVNARVLLEELAGLESAIRKSFGIDALPDMRNLFAALPNTQVNTATQNAEHVELPEGIKETRVELESVVSDAEKQHSGMVSVGSAIRQSAILEKIKISCRDKAIGSPFNGCRMKDLVAEFPDVSERTIRYDLQRLLQQGAVDRVGNGGPASYYVMK
ncbi:MAG: DeoR family transcriptional regulator [Candidatus Harrisonbacteria bacterium]|nr:DeoR family transcriptional regulator [Candidatus Harrisonbacteria bacterium]